MKMLSAAVVVSQVLLAAGCRPAPCDEGCELVTTYEPKVRLAHEWCSRQGEMLQLFVPITSCDVVDTEPQFLGSCVEAKDGGARCTRRGLCLKYQVVKESRFSCKCAPATPQPLLQCESDKNCPLKEFCRAKEVDGVCSATETECVPFSTLDETCGGRVLPCFAKKCAGGLACQGDGLAVDRPGTCQLVPVCMAIPQCPAGSYADPACTRLDFATRACFKETLCGREEACRVGKKL